jgi:hypothetical protein
VTATVSGSQVDLSWPGTTNESVTVSTSQTFDVSSSPFPLEKNKPKPIQVLGFENNTRYAFRVRPVFAEGTGPSSTTVFATPQASGTPSNVSLVAGRGVNTLNWDAVSGITSYDVTWSALDTNGEPILDGNGDPVGGTQPNITETHFRHASLPLPPCSTFNPTCPTYAYDVKPSGNPSATVLRVEAVSTDLRPVPPFVTNADSIILAGVKPSGTRVDIKDSAGTVVQTVPLDPQTDWTAKVLLDSDATFVFRLVAVDGTGLASIETTYQVTRDTDPPAAPTNVQISCESETSSTKKVTLSGNKESGIAVFRKLEPNAPDQQIVGATSDTPWSGVIEIENSTPSIDVITKDAAGNASRQPVQTDIPACP